MPGLEHRQLVFNGLDPEWGLPMLTGLTSAGLCRNLRRRRASVSAARRAEPVAWIRPEDPSSAGWGVIFAGGTCPRVRAALEPLLEHRGVRGEHVFEGPRGFLSRAETKSRWLGRHRGAPGPANPQRVPYYLLLVGSPESLPFDFQFRLAQHHAVGRLSFEDPAHYRRYAETVVRFEREGAWRPRRTVLFGVENTDDPATANALEKLVRPMARLLGEMPGWQVEAVLGPSATKERLSSFLGGGDGPALLLTSSHGLGPGASDEDRLGALVCSDWPGPEVWAQDPRPLPQGHCFTAADLPAEADLTGLVTFHLACFSGGVPRFDSFLNAPGGRPLEISPEARLARLPGALLTHPAGGALAVIAHVDRVKGYSYLWPGAGGQPDAHSSVLWRLMEGRPVGDAVRYLSERHAALSGELSLLLLKLLAGEAVEEEELADYWVAAIDARSYLVLGDPAVRLCPISRP